MWLFLNVLYANEKSLIKFCVITCIFYTLFRERTALVTALSQWWLKFNLYRRYSTACTGPVGLLPEWHQHDRETTTPWSRFSKTSKQPWRNDGRLLNLLQTRASNAIRRQTERPRSGGVCGSQRWLFNIQRPNERTDRRAGMSMPEPEGERWGEGGGLGEGETWVGWVQTDNDAVPYEGSHNHQQTRIWFLGFSATPPIRERFLSDGRPPMALASDSIEQCRNLDGTRLVRSRTLPQTMYQIPSHTQYCTE